MAENSREQRKTRASKYLQWVGLVKYGLNCTYSSGAFHYARPTGQRPVELATGKWNDIVRKKQNFQADRNVSFTFRPKFRFLPSEVGLETRRRNGTASFGRTGPTSQRGPPEGGPLFPMNFHLDRSVRFMFEILAKWKAPFVSKTAGGVGYQCNIKVLLTQPKFILKRYYDENFLFCFQLF